MDKKQPDYLSINLHCYDCERNFEIFVKHFMNKESIACPNCGKQLDDEILSKLKNVFTELKAVLISIESQNDELKGWGISLNWGNQNPLPKIQRSQNFDIDSFNYQKPIWDPFNDPIRFQVFDYK